MKNLWNVKEQEPGGFFDLSTLAGVARGVFYCLAFLIFGWNLGSFYEVFGLVFLGDPIILPDREVRGVRGIAVVFAGSGVVIGSVYFFILYFDILRVRASCKGQWCDGISKEELYREDSLRSEDENDDFQSEHK